MKTMTGRILSLVVLIMLLFLPVSSALAGNVPIEAVEGATVDLSKYDIIHPTELQVKTTDKNMITSGKAIAGSAVYIKLYGTSDLNKKSFNLEKLPKDDQYILLSEETVVTGNMGFFQKQLTLVGGINKIEIKFADENIAPVNIIVYVQEKASGTTAQKQEAPKQIKISNVKPLLK